MYVCFCLSSGQQPAVMKTRHFKSSICFTNHLFCFFILNSQLIRPVVRESTSTTPIETVSENARRFRNIAGYL